MLSTGWAVALTLALHAAPLPTRTPTAPWPDDRPITHLFQNLGHDLAALPSTRTAGILAVGALGAGLVHGSDGRLSRWTVAEGPSSHTAPGRIFGNGWTQWAAAGGTYAVGRMTGVNTISHIGSDLIRVQALTGLVTYGLKISVNRTRPSGAPRSFPSGHASATFASATILQSHFGWRAGVPAYIVAAYVGWTRVRDNVHWISDVVFGAAVGVIAGETVASPHHRRAVTVVPIGTPGGAAVYVFWSPSGASPRGSEPQSR